MANPEKNAAKKKKRHVLRGLLIGLSVVVVVCAGVYLWFIWPDLPPHPMQALTNKVSSLFSHEQAVHTLDPQTQRQADAEVAKQMNAILAPKPGSKEEKQAQILTQLKSTGLPVLGAYIVDSPQGNTVLALSVPYKSITGGFSTSAGLSEGFSTLQRILDNKNLNLAGMHDVTMFVEDDQGRPLFGIAAPVSTIEGYRAGKVTRSDLIRSMAFKGESRSAILDTFRNGVMK